MCAIALSWCFPKSFAVRMSYPYLFFILRSRFPKSASGGIEKSLSRQKNNNKKQTNKKFKNRKTAPHSDTQRRLIR